MTLRTFFKNLFAPDSEAKPLPTPLDLRLLEHYETWQKNREEDKKKERIERSELYQVLFQDNDSEDVRKEEERRFFDHLITQSTCLRAATVADYDEWLTDWLQAGESITYYSGESFSTWQLHYVQDPDTWVSLIQDRRYGASFPKGSQYVFIIPKQYDCRDYLSAFCVENNAVYGWSNNEPGIYGKGSPSHRDNPHIPAFTDTVDQQMCQRAQAEHPEVDALDLRVFQEKDAYMRRQREMLARHTAQRTFDDLERAQLIAADEEAERLEKLTLSNADSARPATYADYDRWLEAWVRAGNEISYYSDRNFNEQNPIYYYVVDPEADFYVSNRTARRFIIPKEYDCREYLYKFCVSPRAVVYGWADNKPVMHTQYMHNLADYPDGYIDTVDARLRQQARLKYRQGE